MRRVLPDTNIYGRILEKSEQDIIYLAAQKGYLKGVFVVYGFDPKFENYEMFIKEIRRLST